MGRWFRRSPTGRDGFADAAAFDAARSAREGALVGQERVVTQIEALLFRHDPIGINFDENSDEYRPEAQTIVLRLSQATSADDVRTIVHEEFTAWFDAETAGPPDRYAAIAAEIWALEVGRR